MDGDNGLNMRNWGYYEAAAVPSRGHLGLQLMSPMLEKPLLDTRGAGLMGPPNGGPFHHHGDIGASRTMFAMDYMNMRDTWMIPETSSALAQQHMQMIQAPDLVKEERAAMAQIEEVGVELENNNVSGTSKKRRPGPKAQKLPKPKKAKKGPRAPKPENGLAATSGPRARVAKKPTEIMINGINMDISSIPTPVCSCTGASQQCYRWGSGGWQSACCTTGLSMYPLPRSTKRRGARIAGRKMSIGAFKKVLEKHAAEGYNFANPIDLRTHWAKHGTNKFVTIR